MADVAMPRLSDSMEEGTILKWLKSDGDEVKRGEELVEIETDKANMTYEADSEGVLAIVAQEGDTLAVGETIARIGADAGGGGEAQAEEPAGGGEEPERDEPEPAREGVPRAEDTAPEEEREPAPVATAERVPQPDDGNGRVKASPIARRMARDLGVELATLEGSGPGGRIVKADVEAAAQNGGKRETAPEPEEEPKREVPKPVAAGDAGKGETSVEDLTRLQQTIARRMAESKATAPEFVI